MSQTVEIALFYYRCKRSQLMRDPLKICHVSDCWVRGPAAPVSCVYGIWEWHTIYVITKHTDKGVSGHRKLLGIALRTSRPGESLHLGVMRCVSKIKAAFRRSMTQSRGKSLARLEGIRRPRCIVKLDLSVHVPETEACKANARRHMDRGPGLTPSYSRSPWRRSTPSYPDYMAPGVPGSL